MRKEQGIELTDRIAVTLPSATPTCSAHGDWIRARCSRSRSTSTASSTARSSRSADGRVLALALACQPGPSFETTATLICMSEPVGIAELLRRLRRYVRRVARGARASSSRTATAPSPNSAPRRPPAGHLTDTSPTAASRAPGGAACHRRLELGGSTRPSAVDGGRRLRGTAPSAHVVDADASSTRAELVRDEPETVALRTGSSSGARRSSRCGRRR